MLRKLFFIERKLFCFMSYFSILSQFTKSEKKILYFTFTYFSLLVLIFYDITNRYTNISSILYVMLHVFDSCHLLMNFDIKIFKNVVVYLLLKQNIIKIIICTYYDN